MFEVEEVYPVMTNDYEHKIMEVKAFYIHFDYFSFLFNSKIGLCLPLLSLDHQC